MPIRNQKPVIWSPAGVSDVIDSSAMPRESRGLMAKLANLVQAPQNIGLYVPRPAAVQYATLPDYGGGPVTALLTVGNIAYGMYASAAFPGKDRPFVLNLQTGQFVAISGMTTGNLPSSQPTTGDWTPPVVDQVGTRIVFAHPGFAGGQSVPHPVLTASLMNVTSGSPVLTGLFSPTPEAEVPEMIGLIAFDLQANIPLGATVTGLAHLSLNVMGTGTSGNSFFTASGSDLPNLAVGQWCTGAGISAVITSIVGATVNISTPLTANLAATPVTVNGWTITLNRNCTGSQNGELISFFGGGGAVQFGWLDVSGFSVTTAGSTTLGLPIISGNPTIAGVQPGMTVTGKSFTATGTTVQATGTIAYSIIASLTVGSAQLVVVSFPGEFAVGSVLVGSGIPGGTTILAASATAIYMSQAATMTASSVTVFVSGTFIILSQAAVATVSQATDITIAGGTPSAPLWGAGDTNTNPLAGGPVFVRQFFGRAYFGINTTSPPTAGVTASDSGIACQVTNANQVQLFQNAIPVTAAYGMPLLNQLGGVVQSLVVFQGDSNIEQITGDFALATWAQNASEVATGTLSPNSLAPTPRGLIFAASDGLRVINNDGSVTEPLGTRGKGLTLPLSNAVNPSRIAASFNENVYRFTVSWLPPLSVQAVWGSVLRTDEFWYHLDLDKFTGPHTSTMDLIAPWPAVSSFVCAPSWARGNLYRSDAFPGQASLYVENGRIMSWTYTTTLLPDNPEMMANSLVESSIFAGMSASTQWLASAIDDQGVTLDQAYVWRGYWSTPSPPLVYSPRGQVPIAWINPIVFRQAAISITGPSEAQTLVGTLMLRYQRLGYQLAFAPLPSEFTLGQSPLGGPDVLGP